VAVTVTMRKTATKMANPSSHPYAVRTQNLSITSAKPSWITPMMRDTIDAPVKS